SRCKKNHEQCDGLKKMVKRIVIEISGMDPELRLLRGCREKHETDAKKSYQKRSPLPSPIGQQESTTNDGQGWNVIDYCNQKVLPNKYHDDDICKEECQCKPIYIDRCRS